MTKIHIYFICFVFLYLFIPSNAQSGFCSSGQLQSTVSNLNGNQIATHLPSIQYQPSYNRFLVSIYNNNQVLSQTECANFPGSSVPQPGVTNFQVFLSCTPANGNTGFGLAGGIQLQVNNSVSTTVASVNVATGQTYTNIPVVPINAQESLADRICTLTLQATLFCIQGNGNCFPSFNEPIISYTYSTGPSGHFGACTFGDLTCYANRGILWRSALLWIIVDASFIFLTCFFIVPNLYYYLRIKPMDDLYHKSLKALNKSTVGNVNLKKVAFDEKTYSQYVNQSPLIQSAPAAGRYTQRNNYDISDDDNQSREEIDDRDEDDDLLIPTAPILTSRTKSGGRKKTPKQIYVTDEASGERVKYQQVSSGPSSSQPKTNRLSRTTTTKQPPKPLELSFN